MKKEYKYYLVFGLIILLAGIVLQIFWSGLHPAIARTLIVVGWVLIVLGAVRHKIYGEGPEEDERTKKINAFALSYSWVATIVLVGVLLLLDHYNILKITAMLALGLTMFVMIVVAVVAEWYIKRKGDIE